MSARRPHPCPDNTVQTRRVQTIWRVKMKWLEANSPGKKSWKQKLTVTESAACDESVRNTGEGEGEGEEEGGNG